MFLFQASLRGRQKILLAALMFMNEPREEGSTSLVFAQEPHLRKAAVAAIVLGVVSSSNLRIDVT